jgi:hypothetical protein
MHLQLHSLRVLVLLGTQTALLVACSGAMGPPGPQGPQGVAGAPGLQGQQGSNADPAPAATAATSGTPFTISSKWDGAGVAPTLLIGPAWITTVIVNGGQANVVDDCTKVTIGTGTGTIVSAPYYLKAKCPLHPGNVSPSPSSGSIFFAVSGTK